MKFQIKKVQPKPVKTTSFDIPHMTPKKKKHLKAKVFGSVSLIIVLAILFFAGLFYTAQWFDTNKMIFQNPVTVFVRQPILIEQRLVVSPLPKVTYVEVSPLTTPQQIVEATKQGTIPQYADSGNLTPISKDTIRALIHNKIVQMWGEGSWNEIDYIITHESNYNPYIVNKSSGACGIFQALPCSKLPSLDITDQINWGVHYIEERYGSAKQAYNFKREKGWY